MKKALSILLAVVVAFTIAPVISGGSETAYAAETFAFEKTEYTVSAFDDEWIELKLKSGDVVKATSSNSKVVSVDYYEYEYVGLCVQGPGTATITATDEAGKKTTCTITVATPAIKVADTDLAVSIDDEDCTIDVLSGYDLSYKISDTSVIKLAPGYIVDDTGCRLQLLKPGKAVVTVSDAAGKTAKVNVTVTEARWSLGETSKQACTSDEYRYIDVNNITYNLIDAGFTVKSSNEKVVKASVAYDHIALDYIGKGTATITVSDSYGKSQICKVTVTDAKWSLEKTALQTTLDKDSAYIKIKDYDPVDGYVSLSTKSSNTKIVKPNVDADGDVYLELVGVGTATVTVSDQYGKSQTCKVTVKPSSFKLNTKSVKYDNYGMYYPEYYYSDNGYNTIASVKSENSKVVSAKRVKSGGEYQIELTPVGAGTANIIATDQYGQSASIKVVVTKKYIDEMKYPEIQYAYCPGLEYGDTTLSVYCDIAAKITTTINKKTYTAKLDDYGTYVFKGLPKMSVGRKFKVTIQKGQAKSELIVTVQKKDGRYLAIKVKNPTYTGKVLKPAVTIKDGKTTLKKGMDYTVKYSNYKKVGKGKVSIEYKGNYKGVTAAAYEIHPKTTSISKVIANKKGFTVKWNKQSAQVNGYQIQYSTNKNFKNATTIDPETYTTTQVGGGTYIYNARPSTNSYGTVGPVTNPTKTITISKNSTTSRKISGLKAKKKYYVRVRTYKTVGKTKYYSTWSKAKTVTTKK